MKLDMVFEGGGAKGMVFVGAMRAVEERGLSPNRLVGTSAGAITATLLAAGYDTADMEQALAERDEHGKPVFAQFMDPPAAEDFSDQDIRDSLTMRAMRKVDIPLVPEYAEEWMDRKIVDRLLKLRGYATVFSFIERGGLYVGRAFREWLELKLDKHWNAEKHGPKPFSQMSFREFHAATGCDLSLVASDTTAHEMLVLNHRTAPNCPVVRGVRMSMSIPFAWHEVRWAQAWDPYVSLDKTGRRVDAEASLAGHVIVDGGVLSNFAIDLLTSSDPRVLSRMGADPCAADAVVGLLIDEEVAVPGAPPAPSAAVDDERGLEEDVGSLRTVQRIRNLLDTMMDARDKRQIEIHAALVCHLPAKGYGTMEFDMSDERRQALVEGGYAAMRAHLDERGLGPR